jgi:hypothetical protein
LTLVITDERIGYKVEDLTSQFAQVAGPAVVSGRFGRTSVIRGLLSHK